MTVYFPEGNYLCEIKDHTLAKNERSGNYQVIVEFVPLSFVERDGSVTEVEHYARTMFFAITERAASYTSDKLQALGLVFDKWSEINTDDSISIVGNEVMLKCEHDTYEGRAREKWDPPARGFVAEPVDESEASEVDAMFGNFAKGSNADKPEASKPPKSTTVAPSKPKPQGAQSRAAQSAAGPPADTSDEGDDLPF